MRVGTILLGVALGWMPWLARAADWPPRYDIPKLDHIKIDGDGADWGDKGFRIETLAPADGRIVPSTDFDATVRLGWNDEGLLVLVSVVDDKAVEAGLADDLWKGDCVELIVGMPLRQILHYAISPGVDPNHPEPHVTMGQYVSTPPLNWARKKTAAGYIVEAKIPIAKVDQKWREGTLGFQIVITDSDKPGHRARHVWFPADDVTADLNHLHSIRAADFPSPAVTVAVGPMQESQGQGHIAVICSGDDAGKRVEVGEGPPLKEAVLADDPKLPLAVGKIRRIGDRWGESLTIPPAQYVRPYKMVNVYLDSKQVAQFVPPDRRAARRRQLMDMDLQFRPAVFSGEVFPKCDFANPAKARELIGGEYTLKTRFFDPQYQQVETAEKPGRYGAVVDISTESGVTVPPRLVSLFKQKESIRWRTEEFDLQMTLPPQMGIDAQVVKEQQRALAEYMKARFVEDFSGEPDTALLLGALADAKPGDGPLGGRNSIWARNERWWYPLKQKLVMHKYQYLVDLPIDYVTTKEPSPLLLFLHGSGERGDDLQQVRQHGPPKLAKAGWTWPFIVVSPQCPAGEWWSAQQLASVLNEVVRKYHVDRDRIYVTGLSMGGYGAWELAAEYPDKFAAIAPICGAGGVADAERLKNVPAWVFHGEEDPAVPFKRSVEMIEALKKVGGRVRFTPYPGVGHDSWTRTYDNAELYQWLLKQKLGAPAEPPAK